MIVQELPAGIGSIPPLAKQQDFGGSQRIRHIFICGIDLLLVGGFTNDIRT